jgi:hypothetical protein
MDLKLLSKDLEDYACILSLKLITLINKNLLL